jgi:hypothetical protein
VGLERLAATGICSGSGTQWQFRARPPSKFLMLNLRFAQCGWTYKLSGASAGAEPMWIMGVYVLVVVVSELIVVAIGLVLDRIYPIASLPVSLSLFFAVLWFGWLVAVRLTEPKHAKKSKFLTEN